MRTDYKLEGCKQEVYDLQAQLEGVQRLLQRRSTDLEAMRTERDYYRAQRDRRKEEADQLQIVLRAAWNYYPKGTPMSESMEAALAGVQAQGYGPDAGISFPDDGGVQADKQEWGPEHPSYDEMGQ